MTSLFSVVRSSVFLNRFLSLFVAFAMTLQMVALPISAFADVTLNVYNDNGLVSTQTVATSTQGTLNYVRTGTSTETPTLDVLAGIFVDMGVVSTQAVATAGCTGGQTSSLSASTTVTVDASGNVISTNASASATCLSNDSDDDDDKGHEPHKIEICHIPQGNPENAHTIDVDDHSVTLTAHLAHGDSLGACVTSVPPPPPSPPAPKKLTIVATKIVCDDESKLPNWGVHGPDITATTATDYVAAHPGCVLTPDWKFQWGFGSKTSGGDLGVSDLTMDFVGEADGSGGPGTHTGSGYNDWKTTGVTDASGSVTTQIDNLAGASVVWVREVLKDGYIPFTSDGAHLGAATSTPSAKMYCHTDVVYYDNLEFIGHPTLGETYYCVAFNAQKKVPQPVNTQPVITVVGANPIEVAQGSTYVDPSATVLDAEDGDITNKLVTTGVVNTAVLDTYTITYNATDSQSVAAVTKTRTVKVVVAPVCTAPVDIVFVIDRSGSMKEDGTNPEQPLTQAKDATKLFIDTLSTSSDRVGIVSYNQTPVLNQTLTNNFVAAKASLTFNAVNYTNTAGAIDMAVNELTNNGRPGVKHVMILLSDGFPNLPNVTAASATAMTIAAANSAKSKGILVYTVGLGSEVNPVLMSQLATLPEDYFYAPTGADLAAIYRAISFAECQRAPASIAGKKIHDVNGNGAVDQGDTGIANWQISLTPVGVSTITVRLEQTATSGEYVFNDVTPGMYNLCEVNQADWSETFPSPTSNNGCYVITVNEGDNKTGKNFLNTEVKKPQCSDGKDNDGDGKIDYPADTGCDNSNDDDENNKPVITVLPLNPMVLTLGGVFTDPGATAFDMEDGTITPNIVKTGTVNANATGTYTITYNVSDSKGLAADTKTRSVIVAPQCSDGIDNDHDGKIDAVDTGCDNPNDNDENNKPVITLLGANPINIIVGTPFTDPGANATDTEDCIGKTQAQCNTFLQLTATGIVNTNATGTYTITYTAIDSKGLTATPKTRMVKVNPVVTECNDGKDNDGDGKIDMADLGCDNPNDDDENNKPVITVLGSNPLEIHLGVTYVDSGANANDAEDCVGKTQAECNTLLQLSATGTVNTGVLGNYTITYNAIDSKGLTADPKTRTVKVITSCSDGKDNDGDGLVDYPADLGCDNPQDESENTKPVITLLGDVVMNLIIGTPFTDLGANATDTEDCIGKTQAQCNTLLQLTATGTVNTNATGTYMITYTAKDSEGLFADPKTRTINVNPVLTECSDGKDNDGDGLIDYPADLGCDDQNDNDENDKPVISLIGNNPLTLTIGGVFADPGANATDTEDCIAKTQGECNTLLQLTATGTVNMGALGSYTITYNATDSKGLAALPKTRTVNVVSGGCTSNCGGGGGGTDNQRPSLVLLGANPLEVIVGTTFTDPGATASDPEDGNISSQIIVTGGPVTTTTVSNYTLSYDVSDSKGLAAGQVRRDVHVVPAPIVGCTVNCGGGVTPIYLTISNEKITSSGTSSVTITWNTNQPANSRVVYGLDSMATPGNAPSYGYPLSSATDAQLTTTHSMVLNGIPSAIATHFRPVSSDGVRTVVGVELHHASLVSVPQECFYLREYMRYGTTNNPEEVRKLQTFLRNTEGFSTLPVTGFFDLETDRDVRTFQDRYKTDVLDTWNLPANTGYVYYTTQKKINELYCKRTFPLSQTQLAEIATFRELIARANAISAQEGMATPLPLVGINDDGVNEGGAIAGVSTARGGEIASGVSTTRGRFALTDLLATSPNLPGFSGTETASTTEGVLSTTTTRSGLAAIGTLPSRVVSSVRNFFSSVLHHIAEIVN